MKKITFFSLLIICITIVLAAGCTNTAGTPAATTAPVTTAPVPVAAASTIAAPVTTQAATAAATSAMTASPTPTTSTTDPILHRWIRQYAQKGTGIMIGYEFKFFPDGTLDYRVGYTKEVSDNIYILTVTDEASGTWSSLGNMTYMVKMLPVGTAGGAPIIREYTLVPAHENKDYPGVVIAEHLESSYELNELTPGQVLDSNTMYFPTIAKID